MSNFIDFVVMAIAVICLIVIGIVVGTLIVATSILGLIFALFFVLIYDHPILSGVGLLVWLGWYYMPVIEKILLT